MKNINNIITTIKMIAKYGAYIIVLVDALNFLVDGFERIEKEKNEKNDSK